MVPSRLQSLLMEGGGSAGARWRAEAGVSLSGSTAATCCSLWRCGASLLCSNGEEKPVLPTWMCGQRIRTRYSAGYALHTALPPLLVNASTLLRFELRLAHFGGARGPCAGLM